VGEHNIYSQTSRGRWRVPRMSNFLRTAVAENSTLQPGNTVQVVFPAYHLRRGETESVRWGIASVEHVGAPMRARREGVDHRYRVIKVPWPFGWQEEIASIVAYPLNPNEYIRENGYDDRIRWRKHYAQERLARVAGG